MPKNTLDTQVGGDHYKSFTIQPMEFFYVNQIPHIEACICKYVLRHDAKNGAEDLRKARHLIDFLLEHDYNEED